MLADILKENNVNNEGMRFDPGARTALAFVTLKKNGEREFMFYRNPSADMLLQESELDLDLIKKVFKFKLHQSPYIHSTKTKHQMLNIHFMTLSGKNISLWIHKFDYRTMQIGSYCCNKSCKRCWCSFVL